MDCDVFVALIALECPECGRTTHLEDDMESGFCLHCGSELTNKSTIRSVGNPDDAEHRIRIIYRGLFKKVMITVDGKESFTIDNRMTIRFGIGPGEHELSLRPIPYDTPGGEIDRLSFVVSGDHDFKVVMGGKLKLRLKIIQIR